MYCIKISVADIVFEILSPKKKFITWLEKNYKPFFSIQNAEFKLFLKFGKKKRNNITPSFISKWPGKYFHAETDIFDVDIDFTRGKVTASFAFESGIVDLLKFLCGVILAKRGGFLLHACSVVEKSFSYVFFGPSESGKTTIAGLSSQRITRTISGKNLAFSQNLPLKSCLSEYKIILSDETTAVVKKRNIYYAYATPFFGEFGQVKQNVGAPIKAIFYIKKDTCFKHYEIKPVNAVKEILCHTVINILDHQVSELLLGNLNSLSEKIPCYELHFKKEPKIWEYINGTIK